MTRIISVEIDLKTKNIVSIRWYWISLREYSLNSSLGGRKKSVILLFFFIARVFLQTRHENNKLESEFINVKKVAYSRGRTMILKLRNIARKCENIDKNYY